MSSQQSSNTVIRAAQSQIQDLGARLAVIEARVASHESMLANQTTQIRSLETAKDNTHHFVRMTAAELHAHVKRMDYVESVIRAAQESGDLTLPPGILEEEAELVQENDAQTGGGQATNGPVPLTADDQELLADPALKSVVVQTLVSLTGLPHFHDNSTLVYPSVPESDPGWPSTTNRHGERSPYMRFDFSKPYDDPQNWERLQTWARYVMDHGSETVPAATSVLSRMSFEQVLMACRGRFNYIRKQFRRKSVPTVANTESNLPPVEPQVAANAGNQLVPNENIDPTLLNAQVLRAGHGAPPATAMSDIRSRAVGKSEQRVRQRSNLTGENQKYQHPKYNGAVKPGAMSDDEDKYSLVAGVWVKSKGAFVSWEWDFISNELRDCRNAIVAVLDPNEKARPVPRERGAPKAGSPRKWEKDKWAMEEWMIDSDVLALHPEWLANGLVLRNGPEWGGTGEQVVRRPAKRSRTRGAGGRSVRASAAAGPGPSTARARQARKELQEAQQRAREVQGEESLDTFAMNLD